MTLYQDDLHKYCHYYSSTTQYGINFRVLPPDNENIYIRPKLFLISSMGLIIIHKIAGVCKECEFHLRIHNPRA